MKFGIDLLQKQKHQAWGRCGLLSNHASLGENYVHAIQIAQQVLGPQLKVLFGPQHGFYGTEQDNMIETPDLIHAESGLPLYSLYGKTRVPTADMLAGIDTLLIDLPVVGCRVYTFKYTLAECLRAAKKHGKRIVVLDRPNPLGGTDLEGPVLTEGAESFVGQFSIPLRHALTMGECARFFNQEIGAELSVVAVEGWDARAYYPQSERPWIMTSPNLPSLETVLIYAGTVLFEGTNVSEGRGTTLPFLLLGAPYIKSATALIERTQELLGNIASGFHLLPAVYRPTFGKWIGQECHGVQIHVDATSGLRPVALGLCLLRAFADLGGKHFAWKQPPYEYNFDVLPIKLIMGRLDFLQHFEKFSLRDPYWHAGHAEFSSKVAPLLLYPRSLRSL